MTVGQKKIINDTGSLVVEEVVSQLNNSIDSHTRNIWIPGSSADSFIMGIAKSGEGVWIKDVVLAFDFTGANLQNIIFGIAVLSRGNWDTQPYPVDAKIIIEKSGFTTTPIVGDEILSIGELPSDTSQGSLPVWVPGPAQVRFYINNSDPAGYDLRASFYHKATKDSIILQPNYRSSMLGKD